MLSSKARQELKAQAHHLKPVLLLGAQGVGASVRAELARALRDHELIKVRLPALTKEEREQCIAELLVDSGAEIVGRIGRVLTLYRPNPEKSKGPR